MRPRSLLIIDNDTALTSQLAELFRLEGYAVTTASDGLETLQWLAAGEEPDLLLLDLHMEGLGGDEFSDELRAQGTPRPILLLTGDVDPRWCAKRVGAQDYLPKPFELPVLLVRVERLLHWAS